MATCSMVVDRKTCASDVHPLTEAALASKGASPMCPLHAAIYYLCLAKGALHDLERAHPELPELRANPAYDFVRYAENCLSALEGYPSPWSPT